MSVHCQHPRVVDLRIKHTAAGLRRCIGKSLRLLAIGKLSVGNVLARAMVACREMTQSREHQTGRVALVEHPLVALTYHLGKPSTLHQGVAKTSCHGIRTCLCFPFLPYLQRQKGRAAASLTLRSSTANHQGQPLPPVLHPIAP